MRLGLESLVLANLAPAKNKPIVMVVEGRSVLCRKRAD